MGNLRVYPGSSRSKCHQETSPGFSQARVHMIGKLKLEYFVLRFYNNILRPVWDFLIAIKKEVIKF